MTRAAKTLSWTAFIFGIPPMLVCILWLFGGGWSMFVYLAMAALPPLPLVLTQDSTDWPTPPPIVTAALAVASIFVSIFIYSQFFRFSIWISHS
jgi:hypothetical protein